ncbi:MAG: bifunctional DNA-formamidopyrimidine glycosylase/DNA-(apurinic or apyrimidinic site) lyase [Acidobacteria bacterium]|nr:bifunctional DNA-formamidopyrimidine glycosylase/DNA-(apurinic or apyrimidinic site) lyase [Acidobacteriota bacterium]
MPRGGLESPRVCAAMPEMPEVDHVVRVLDRVWSGKRIDRISLRSPKVMLDGHPAATVRGIAGSEVKSVTRRGKFIIVHMSGDRVLLMHLRMTGCLIYAGPRVRFDRSTRIVFRLADGSQIALDDTRHLARIRLVPEGDLWRQPELKKLGHEPFDQEFTVARLAELMSRSLRSVKAFLLDQTRIVGLGNIYAAEALFRARIDPRRRCRQVAGSIPGVARLHHAIMTTVRVAFRSQGTVPTHMEFIESDPFGGSARWARRERFFVYDREGKPCRRCGRPIARIKQGQRSTYFCRTCQR